MQALDPEMLRTSCDEHRFDFRTTDELEPIDDAFGQERLSTALSFAMDIDREGYNLYVLGRSQSGQFALLREALAVRAAGGEAPCDWCYLNNFEDAQKPIALQLPVGESRKLQSAMDNLISTLREAIPATFSSDAVRAQVNEIEEEYKRRQDDELEAIHTEASRADMAILHTPGGFGIAPIREGEIIGPQEFEKLDNEERQRIENEIERLKSKLSDVLLHAPEYQKQRRQAIEALNRKVATSTITGPLDELRSNYRTHERVLTYLQQVERDILENLVQFGDQSSPQNNPLGLPGPPSPFFKRYKVNVLVENSRNDGAPLLCLDHPSYQRLFGRIEHTAQFGTLVTDFSQIRPGALHRANGGFLVLEARKLLTEPYAWFGLKRAMRSGQIEIESITNMMGFTTAEALEPETIPLRIKLVLLGEPELYYLLCAYDPEFGDMFKVAAEFEDRIERSHDNVQSYARFLSALITRQELLAFDAGAIAEVIDHSSRMANDARRISLQIRPVADLLAQSDYWARANSATVVTRSHVAEAIARQQQHVERLREKLREPVLREMLLIDTEGEQIAQVNGLSVLSAGDNSVGQPSRITATVRIGKGEVVDIQRQAELSGPIHSKGVMILAAYLAARFAPSEPLSLFASLAFEQTYGLVDGDSASAAELCAILSALARVPIRQSLAITGSVNQLGQVQAIGGVNEKIEAFFDLCDERGLTGAQGVLIPRANTEHLMLRPNVVDAARDNLFHIHAIDHIDEAIALLTGRPAGEMNDNGVYPDGTINALVTARLAQYSQAARQFGSSHANH